MLKLVDVKKPLDFKRLRQNLHQVLLHSVSPRDSDQEQPLTWLKIKTKNYINVIPSSPYWASLEFCCLFWLTAASNDSNQLCSEAESDSVSIVTARNLVDRLIM